MVLPARMTLMSAPLTRVSTAEYALISSTATDAPAPMGSPEPGVSRMLMNARKTHVSMVEPVGTTLHPTPATALQAFMAISVRSIAMIVLQIPAEMVSALILTISSGVNATMDTPGFSVTVRSMSVTAIPARTTDAVRISPMGISAGA